MTTTTRNCWCTEASMLRRWVSVLVRVTSSTTDHTHHGRSNQSPLAPFPRDSAVQDGRAYVQSLAWICADIPESTSSCCRSTQSSLSLARRSVRTSRLQVMPVRLSTVGGQAFSVSGPTSRQRLRNFFFPISFIIRHYSGLPVLSFITVSGSWSDFYLILGPIFKKWLTGWLIDWMPPRLKWCCFGSGASSLRRLSIASSLAIGSTVIQPLDVVRDLGVLLDRELTMKQHVNHPTSVCFYHLRRLRQLGRHVSQAVIKQF